MSEKTQIDALLDVYLTNQREHRALNKEVDRLKDSRYSEEIAQLKARRCRKKTAVDGTFNQLSKFSPAALRVELEDRQKKLDLCDFRGSGPDGAEYSAQLEAERSVLARALRAAQKLSLVQSDAPAVGTTPKRKTPKAASG